jgi:hypothetical protein
MRIRLTIEYDNDEGDEKTLKQEEAAWRKGDVEFMDLAALADDEPDITIKFEQI